MHFDHGHQLQECTEATSVHGTQYLLWATARQLKHPPDCFQINWVFVQPDDNSVLHTVFRHLWSQIDYFAFLSLNCICRQLAQRPAAEGLAHRTKWPCLKTGGLLSCRVPGPGSRLECDTGHSQGQWLGGREARTIVKDRDSSTPIKQSPHQETIRGEQKRRRLFRGNNRREQLRMPCFSGHRNLLDGASDQESRPRGSRLRHGQAGNSKEQLRSVREHAGGLACSLGLHGHCT